MLNMFMDIKLRLATTRHFARPLHANGHGVRRGHWHAGVSIERNPNRRQAAAAVPES